MIIIISMAKTKKTASPKAPRAGGTEGAGALAKELRSLIPRLDAEGLAFLVEQARVHLYNMEADKLNQAARDLHAFESRSAGKAPAKGGLKPGAAFRIEKSGSGSSYYIIYQNEWIMFSREEMTRLATMANAPATDLEVRGNIFTWLKRERSDMLNSAFIKDKFDDKLKILTDLIRKTFKVRQ
jgi:hypothetical protein